MKKEEIFTLYIDNPYYKRIRMQPFPKNLKDQCVFFLPFKYKNNTNNSRLRKMLSELKEERKYKEKSADKQ